MSLTTADFLMIDAPAILLGTLACLCCALLGNFLILRRQALLGDAISHVVLPGIVAGFLISGGLYPPAIFLGATVAALLAVGLIALIRTVGRVESGAAMGAVFTLMFAAGVLLLERSSARNVHLDVEHTLYGSLEGVLWLGPQRWSDLLDPAVWGLLPTPILTLAVVTCLAAVLIALFYKELKLTSFDPGLAKALGFRPGLVGAGLMAMTAAAAVAAFQAVGSILVIAMFICPAATARMLTDRLSVQIWLSACAAVISAIAGYGLAAFAPPAIGFGDSVSASGMIAVMAGGLQTIAMVVAPRHGAWARWRARRRSSRSEKAILA